jgi:hypothetical protein
MQGTNHVEYRRYAPVDSLEYIKQKRTRKRLNFDLRTVKSLEYILIYIFFRIALEQRGPV